MACCFTFYPYSTMKPPLPNTPTSFLRSPSTLPGHRNPPPPLTVGRVVEVPAPPKPAPPKRTHQTEARVTLRLPDRVQLNTEACACTGVGSGHKWQEASPIELISPRRGGGRNWLLDTRPTASARLREWKGEYSFRTAAPPDRRYLPASAYPSRIAFDVGEEVEKGVFQLHPRRA